MENENQDKDAIVRAKQAILPAGLGDRSDKATALPGNDSPNDTLIDGLDTDPATDAEEYDVPTTHPNRNPNPKPDIDKLSYS